LERFGWDQKESCRIDSMIDTEHRTNLCTVKMSKEDDCKPDKQERNNVVVVQVGPSLEIYGKTPSPP